MSSYYQDLKEKIDAQLNAEISAILAGGTPEQYHFRRGVISGFQRVLSEMREMNAREDAAHDSARIISVGRVGRGAA